MESTKFYLILMRLEFCLQIFGKFSKIKVIKIHPLGGDFFSQYRRTTDRHDEANSHFMTLMISGVIQRQV